MATLPHKKLLRSAERRLRDYVVDPVRQRAHHVSYAMRMLFLAPPITAGAIFLILAFVPQLHEIYRGVVDEHQVGAGLLGLATLFLLSALLYWWNAGLNTAKINLLYLSHGDLGIDRTLGAFRDLKGAFCALAPPAGLMLGLILLHARVTEDGSHFEGAADRLGLHRRLAAELDAMRALPTEVLIALAVTSVLSLAFLAVLFRYRNDKRARLLVFYSSAAIAGVMAPLPLLLPADTVGYYAQLPGPLAVSGLFLIASTTIIIFLAKLSQKLRFPVITTLFLLAVLFAYWNIAGNVVPDVSPKEGHEARTSGSTALTANFRRWLESRPDLAAYRGRAYPVFIFSVQGGGIYAASEGASYLSRLADLCPAFDQHVFAISAVSGGAIGSTIFNGLIFDRKSADGPLACNVQNGGELASAARSVVRSDHLSPVVAFLLPDVLRKIVPFNRNNNDGDRAAALSRSFSRAYAKALGRQPDDWTSLGRAFDSYWSPIKGPPALLLNATSVEAGHRVAFSPFKLKDAGDGTLFAMSELDPSQTRSGLGLMDAAVISARIPGIIPTWRFPTNRRHWNFVDGGYADGSGASTALDVFREVAREIVDAKKYQWLPGGITDVDLRLVMLTDSGKAPSFEELNGSGFSEAVVTLTTLLNVRKLLSSRAVTQAATEVERLNLELGRPTNGSRALIVRLEHETFPLSLGWKISRTTDSIVQLLLGDPSLCASAAEGAAATDDKTGRAVAAIVDNSCVTKHIMDLLAPAGS